MRSVRKGNPNTASRENKGHFQLSIYTAMVHPNFNVGNVTHVIFIVTSGVIEHLLRSISSKQGMLDYCKFGNFR